MKPTKCQDVSPTDFLRLSLVFSCTSRRLNVRSGPSLTDQRIIIQEAEPSKMIALERKTSKGVWFNRDMSDIHSDLEANLRAAGLWEALDYFDLTSAMKQKKIKRFPEFRWIACFPVAEPGQGHYVHVEAITASKKSQLIFVGKTVKGFDIAAAVARKCAELLSGVRQGQGRKGTSRRTNPALQSRRLSIRLPSELVESIEKLGGKRSQHMEKALTMYLDALRKEKAR